MQPTVRMSASLRPGGTLPEIQETMDWLVDHGCSYEGANRRYQAVNVPPEIDPETITAFLTEADVRWEYTDPTYEDIYPEGATDNRPADG